MQNVKAIETDSWERPWDAEKADNIYARDERFFALLVKAVISFLNKNIKLNGKGISHYVFNTGSSYMYLENDGYEFSMCETSGEDQMYMKMPRCICELGDVSVPQEELTSPYVRGVYERLSGNTGKIKAFSAELRRLPLEITLTLHYVLSTTNEGLILMQELIDKLIFQKYFNFAYLGQKVKCSIEFPSNIRMQFNKIDLASAETRQRNIDLEMKVCTNYPIINKETELEAEKTIGKFYENISIEQKPLVMDESLKIYD